MTQLAAAFTPKVASDEGPHNEIREEDRHAASGNCSDRRRRRRSLWGHREGEKFEAEKTRILSRVEER
jgi:hypothetical protein